MNTALLHPPPEPARLTLVEQNPDLASARIGTDPVRSGTASARAEAVSRAVAAASADAAFGSLVAEADAARDGRRWGEAEYLYWRALSLHRLHPGYRVQYGHALKEQNKLADAEVAYRSAWALGESGEDLRQHILYVAAAQGDASPPPMPLAITHPLDEAPWQEDVELAYALLLHRAPHLSTEVLPLLRTAPTRRAMLLALARHPEMAAMNRDLMLLLAEGA